LKKEGAKKVLSAWRGSLASVEPFNKEPLEEACRKLAEEMNIKPSKLIHPTRVAISGTTIGAGLFEMMEVMGKDTVIKRLDYAIDNLAL
ncbi:MAG: glutamate--tRNA ligase, partial [Methanobacteriota archaeon]